MKKRHSLLAAVGAAALVLAPATAASALTIETEGPLVKIDISDTLNCAVNHAGDTSGEFFADTACGTFVAANGTLYGPSSVPAGGSAGQTSWTPVSQDLVGSGTTADPYQITTVVEAPGLRITQVDSYVTGEHHYTTSSTVQNTTDEAVDTTLYHAADCYLGDNDYGFGSYDPSTGAVTCVAPDSQGAPSDASRIEQFIPTTENSNYLYSSYSAVWQAVGTQLPFPDEVQNGDTLIDNGIGLSWSTTLPAQESASYELRTNFSPVEVESLSTTLAIDPAAVLVEETASVHATIVNDNPSQQDLDEARVTLPAGVSYVPGSTVGLDEPTLEGDVLVFSGPRVLDANASFAFDFEIVASNPGDFTLQLNTAVVSRVDVLPSTAVLSVSLPTLPTAISVDPNDVTTGTEVTVSGSIANLHDEDHTVSTITVTLPDSASYIAGSAKGVSGFGGQSLGEPTIVDNTVTFSGPFLIAAGSELTFTLGITPAVAGEHVLTLTGVAESRAVVLESSTALRVTAPVTPVGPVNPTPPPANQLANTGFAAGPGLLLGSAAALLLGTGIALTAARLRTKAE